MRRGCLQWTLMCLPKHRIRQTTEPDLKLSILPIGLSSASRPPRKIFKMGTVDFISWKRFRVTQFHPESKCKPLDTGKS